MLLRARRMIESSFGILVRRFAVLQKPMQLDPEKASKIVASLIVNAIRYFTTCYLEDRTYWPPQKDSPFLGQKMHLHLSNL
ncbi:hypothetical protein OESDEN_22202 [Oesophagostomum dentatum]|uniref:DDE Tnp4 domain-containing protein n=1 Tax=Oesophagostomum dentatum TaxID=61180 RepID=A0A0B1S3Y5_OESDE|nr:hypothetical protein OESDEN_22202 [Oesophagostomum dentatum]